MQSSFVLTMIAGAWVGFAFSHGQALGEEGATDVSLLQYTLDIQENDTSLDGSQSIGAATKATDGGCPSSQYYVFVGSYYVQSSEGGLDTWCANEEERMWNGAGTWEADAQECEKAAAVLGKTYGGKRVGTHTPNWGNAQHGCIEGGYGDTAWKTGYPAGTGTFYFNRGGGARSSGFVVCRQPKCPYYVQSFEGGLDTWCANEEERMWNGAGSWEADAQECEKAAAALGKTYGGKRVGTHTPNWGNAQHGCIEGGYGDTAWKTGYPAGTGTFYFNRGGGARSSGFVVCRQS